MSNKRFKPLIDKSFYMIWIPTVLLLVAATVISFTSPIALVILIATDVFSLYFLFSSLSGYVELRENAVYIKFGFIKNAEIPYERIRGFSKEHKIYSDSTLSIKNALDHVNIKYNKFEIASVSVVSNDELISEIEMRMKAQISAKQPEFVNIT